jgi:hypothetical protein
MARQSIIVIDDFYDDPDSIRDLALSLNYHPKPGATYPGLEAVAVGHDWSATRQRLRAYIDEPCDAPCPKKPEFPQGKFRLAVAADAAERPDMVHVDMQRWSGVVYLSRSEDCRDGLALYRHRPTSSVFWPGEWLQKHYGYLFKLPPPILKRELMKLLRDTSLFEKIGVIPMDHNRAILLMAQVLHGTGEVFGTDKFSGRLTQHFEFYAE